MRVERGEGAGQLGMVGVGEGQAGEAEGDWRRRCQGHPERIRRMSHCSYLLVFVTRSESMESVLMIPEWAPRFKY